MTKYNLFFDDHQKFGDMTLVAARSLATSMAEKAVSGTRLVYTWREENVCHVHDALTSRNIIKIKRAMSAEDKESERANAEYWGDMK